MNRFCKYSTVLLLFMTSGVLFIVVGLIDNSHYRYKIFDFFQIGSANIFYLVDWKFNTNKDNTVWVSNYQIAPIVNLISSVLWTGLVFLLILFTNRQTKKVYFKVEGFWSKVALLNFIISAFIFLFWLLFVDSDFIYDGVYSKSSSIFVTIYDWFLTIIYLPSFIPSLCGSITLESGGDTIHGYEDMCLVSRTMTSFAVTVWALIGAWIFDKILTLKKK